MNNLLKSLFISSFPLFAMTGFFYSATKIGTPPLSIAMMGILIASLGILSFFAWIFIFKKARTDEHLIGFTTVVFIGTAIGVYGLIIQGLQNIPAILLLGLALAWIIYLRWYSFFDSRANNPILKTGNALPVFKLEDENKNEVSSSSFLGQPLYLSFLSRKLVPLMYGPNKRNCQSIQSIRKEGSEYDISKSTTPQIYQGLG